MNLDGREVDIRFLLQSRARLEPHEIPGTSYEPYVNILKPAPNANKPFYLDENLWKNVTIIRSTKCTKFQVHADIENDFLSALTVYLDEVKEFSRPCENSGEFATEASRWEVALKSSPREFWNKVNAPKTSSPVMGLCVCFIQLYVGSLA